MNGKIETPDFTATWTAKEVGGNGSEVARADIVEVSLKSQRETLNEIHRLRKEASEANDALVQNEDEIKRLNGAVIELAAYKIAAAERERVLKAEIDAANELKKKLEKKYEEMDKAWEHDYDICAAEREVQRLRADAKQRELRKLATPKARKR